jgi:hypothetical protein
MSGGYWLWKQGDLTIAYGQPVHLEEVVKHYPDAVPIKPRFIRRGEKVVLTRQFHEDFKTVMDYYGEPERDIEQLWKPYVREYPNDAVPKFASLAADIRRRLEYGVSERIRSSVKEAADAANVRDQ